MLRKIKLMKQLMAIIILLLIIASCARYKTHQYPEANEKNYHVDFYTKSGKDQLKYAKQFAGEGDYEKAIDLFQRIYENTKLESAAREEALLNLGNIYANVLYTGKDYEKTLFYLEKLLKEFPKTEFRSGVTESIKDIKELIRHKEKE